MKTKMTMVGGFLGVVLLLTVAADRLGVTPSGFMQGFLRQGSQAAAQSYLGVSGGAGGTNFSGILVTNRGVFISTTIAQTNSGPVTFPATDRAWVTFGGTNTGFGFNSGYPAIIAAGVAVFAAWGNASQQAAQLLGNVDNSGNNFRLSSFGPRWIEDQRQGRFSYTNAFITGAPVTNITWGNVEARNATGGGGGGLISYRTNAPAATEFTNTAWMIWMSNTVGGAVQPYIAVNVGGSVTNWLLNVTK